VSALPRRLGVLAGIVAVAALAYLVLVHWWFTLPMLRMGDDIAALRTEEQMLRAEIAQRPALELELAKVAAFEQGNPGFLPETNLQLAKAALVQRLEAVVGGASPNPAACQITARTPADTRVEEPFQRATVQVSLRCGMGELAAVLHALESGSPQLFVDNLDMLSRRSYLGTAQEGGALDVRFDLYGYLKSPPPAPAEAGSD
jgi:general secretion pathway protein M